MNKTVIKSLSILGIIGAILGLLFSFLPISNLAVFPASIGFIFGIIAYYYSKKERFSITFSRIVILISLVAISISFGKRLFTKNKVKQEIETIKRDSQSKKDAVKDIEELDELEDLE